MTTSSIPIGEAFRRLLHLQRLKAKQLLLDVQQLELSVRLFMSAQDDLNAAAQEIVTAAQSAADLLRNSVGGPAAEAVAQQLHNAAAGLQSAVDSFGGSVQPQPQPAPAPAPAPNPDGIPVATNPDGSPAATNPDGTPATVDPTQL